MWIGFIWLIVRCSNALFWARYWAFGLLKGEEYLWLAKWLSTSEEWRCNMKLFIRPGITLLQNQATVDIN
jgi:hypothetical protein